MSSQAKSDVEGNAAQSPDGAGEAPEVEVEEKIDLIDIGDSLPSVSLKNEKGEEVDVAQLAAEKGVVMFLVPKADTRRCSGTPVVEKRTILTVAASQRAARLRRVVSEIAFRITRLLASMCTASARTRPLRRASGRERYANFEAHTQVQDGPYQVLLFRETFRTLYFRIRSAC
jgi:hypothetical protein